MEMELIDKGNSKNSDHKHYEYFFTGSKNLDDVLEGGIKTGAITQFYGQPSTGKTNICLAVCALLPPEYKAIYLDTLENFRLAKINEIKEARHLDTAIQNIFLDKIHNSYELENKINNINNFCKIYPEIKLLIIDSIINTYNIDFQGSKFLPDRNYKLSILLFTLSEIAKRHNIAIIITNNQSSSLSSSRFKPSGGRIMESDCIHKSILLRRSHKGYTAKTQFPKPKKALFTINHKGIEDYVD